MRALRSLHGAALLAAATLVAACAAAPNPAREGGHSAAAASRAATDAESLVAAEPEPQLGAGAETPDAPAAGDDVGDPGVAAAGARGDAGGTRPAAAAADGRPARRAGADAGAEPPEPEPVRRTAYGSLETGVVIARVAGEPIDVSELLAHWLHQSSREVQELLDQITIVRLVLAEAQRLGVRLDPRTVAEAEERALAEMEADIRENDPTLDLDRFLSERRGISPERYRQRHRYFTIAGQLTPLVVRAWTLAQEHAHVRLIALEERGRLAEVRAALDEGTSFAEVARRFSAEPDEAERGRLRIVPKDPSPLARMVFATPPGTIGGPFEQAGGFVLVWVEELPEPAEGAWPEIADRVRASLDAQPVDELEYFQWSEAMRERYRIDRLPFLELVGEIDPRPTSEDGGGPRD